ncbi:hypothetical protein FYJ66_08815 [Clostridiales Family XIII bacterium RF-744-FAT-WT-3]|uniref:Uncharacterized protein n=1 Tax=Baileyella intestinalis TaxID=2606709 RepID=A0A6A8MB53_9FIRM|nr:hypothetical protein [Baileyella intestinalis]MST69678.1 hypothetical protein [Baileyella intestinalis]
MTADKNKLKTLNKLTDEGFDTEKKITSIDMKVAYDHGLSGEIGVILELQEAIRDRKVIAYLCNAMDDAKPKPAKTNSSDPAGKEDGNHERDHENEYSGYQIHQ